MAHYGAIGVGPFLGGVAATAWGYGTAFVLSAVGVGLALVVGLAVPFPSHVPTRARESTFANVTRNRRVWAGWLAAISGMLQLESVIAAICGKFPPAVAEKNVAAAIEAHAMVTRRLETVHA